MNVCKVCVRAVLVGVAAVAVGLLGAGCDGKEVVVNPPSGDLEGVSFENFTEPNRSIKVENNTGDSLVIFRATKSSGNIIGGVTPGATVGLAKGNKFTETAGFPLIFVTVDEYRKNKTNPSRAPSYLEIYGFYNAEGSNDQAHKVEVQDIGNNVLALKNLTAYNVEIRKGGPAGKVLGYVGAWNTDTELYLLAGDYDLYPVFKRYSPSDKMVYEATPNFPTGHQFAGRPIGKGYLLGGGTREEFDLAALLELIKIDFSSEGFYIRVVNNAEQAVRLVNGTTELFTTLRDTYVRSGATFTYKIPMDREQTTVDISTLLFRSVSLTGSIEPRTYKKEYIYTVYVKGGILGIEVDRVEESDEPMDLESKFR